MGDTPSKGVVESRERTLDGEPRPRVSLGVEE